MTPARVMGLLSPASPQWISQLTVEPIKVSADDRSVVATARVSTKGSESRHDWSSEAQAGIIRYLMNNRHGTPFEHNQFVFYAHCPIFVYREWHRHRIGISINEESGRYKELDPVFYVPAQERPGLMQVPGGKPGQYSYRDATAEEWQEIVECIQAANTVSYGMYREMLSKGVAKETARECLPVNIYSSQYWTCNARSLMAFLSLRKKLTKREPYLGVDRLNDDGSGSLEILWEGEAFFPSKPMWEINNVADQMEAVFAQAMPITHAAFVAAGYVAP